MVITVRSNLSRNKTYERTRDVVGIVEVTESSETRLLYGNGELHFWFLHGSVTFYKGTV